MIHILARSQIDIESWYITYTFDTDLWYVMYLSKNDDRINTFGDHHF